MILLWNEFLSIAPKLDELQVDDLTSASEQQCNHEDFSQGILLEVCGILIVKDMVIFLFFLKIIDIRHGTQLA